MQHIDTTGIQYDVLFKCPTCGCKKCERPRWANDNLTFLEGYFICCECYEEFCYYDEAFTLKQSQLRLFDI